MTLCTPGPAVSTLPGSPGRPVARSTARPSARPNLTCRESSELAQMSLVAPIPSDEYRMLDTVRWRLGDGALTCRLARLLSWVLICCTPRWSCASPGGSRRMWATGRSPQHSNPAMRVPLSTVWCYARRTSGSTSLGRTKPQALRRCPGRSPRCSPVPLLAEVAGIATSGQAPSCHWLRRGRVGRHARLYRGCLR